MIAVLAILSCVGLYICWEKGENLIIPLVCLGLIPLIIVLRTLVMKFEGNNEKETKSTALSFLIIVLGIAVIYSSITCIGSRPYRYSENVESYVQTVAGFSEMPTIEEIRKSDGSEFYTFNRENGSDSATAIIQYNTETYQKKLLEVHKYGQGDTVYYPNAERGSFTLEGYRFILIDNSREDPFDNLMLIGVNDTERKIAYICFLNLTIDDPLVYYKRSYRYTSKEIISMETFVREKCGWKRHKTEREIEQTTE